jgi:hypothetical protein
MTVKEHLREALKQLEEQPGSSSGPSGHRATAITHIRLALTQYDREVDEAIRDHVAGALA